MKEARESDFAVVEGVYIFPRMLETTEQSLFRAVLGREGLFPPGSLLFPPVRGLSLPGAIECFSCLSGLWLRWVESDDS